MIKNKNAANSDIVSQAIIFGLQEKKGHDIVRLDLRNISTSISDYFVICSADSSTQVRSLADSVEKEVHHILKYDPWRKEGYEHAEWILLDYVDIVVHIFKTEKRQFYGIEDLWGDADQENYKSA